MQPGDVRRWTVDMAAGAGAMTVATGDREGRLPTRYLRPVASNSVSRKLEREIRYLANECRDCSAPRQPDRVRCASCASRHAARVKRSRKKSPSK
jgi:hypothetical protein